MSIRILGGVARGMSLATPKSHSIRPTSVTLKRKLFDSIQSFSGYIFIDICCGSGSVGLEALSRGAEKVFFIDNHPKSIQAVKDNIQLIQKYGIDKKSSTQIIKADITKWATELPHFIDQIKLTHPDEKIFIFFDPPYEELKLYEHMYTQVMDSGFSGKFAIEACKQKTMKIDEFIQKFPEVTKTFEKGTSYFLIYDI